MTELQEMEKEHREGREMPIKSGSLLGKNSNVILFFAAIILVFGFICIF